MLILANTTQICHLLILMEEDIQRIIKATLSHLLCNLIISNLILILIMIKKAISQEVKALKLIGKNFLPYHNNILIKTVGERSDISKSLRRASSRTLR